MPTWYDWVMLGVMLIACAAAGYSYVVFRAMERHLTALEAHSAGRMVPARPATTSEDGWQPIETAPQTGEIIEMRNGYGKRPWYGLFRREGNWWMNVHTPHLGMGDADWVTWRPYTGRPEDYQDPTHGAQDTNEYWRSYS